MCTAELPTISGVTVDTAKAKLLDDAISVSKLAAGWLVTVSIADVAYHVTKGSPLDRAAKEQKRSDHESHLFPHKYAREVLSLVPKYDDRRVIAFTIRLDSQFNVFQVKAALGVLRHQGRFSYGKVDAILKNPDHDRHWWWKDAHELALGLLEKRKSQGAFAGYVMASGNMITEDGEMRKAAPFHRRASRMIVHELMILVNSAVADHLKHQGVQLLFRNQTTHGSDADKQRLVRHLRKIILFPDKELFEQMKGEFNAVIDRPRYSVDHYGHFDLQVPVYAHLTSPIWRYADLVNQRCIRAWLLGEDPPYTIEELRDIGEHLNGETTARPKAEAALHRLKRVSTEQILQMSGDDYSFLVYQVSDGQVPLTQERMGAISERIRKGALSTVDCARIFFCLEEGLHWVQLRWRLLHSLSVERSRIEGVFQNAHMLYGLPSFAEIRFIPQWIEKEQQYRVHGSYSSREIEYTAVFSAKDRELAKTQVAWLLLRRIVNSQFVFMREDVLDVDKEAAVQGMLPGDLLKRLMSYCENERIRKPTLGYNSIGVGARKMPTCNITCRVENTPVSTGWMPGPTVAVAQQRAAWHMLHVLPQVMHDSSRGSLLAEPISVLYNFYQMQHQPPPEFFFGHALNGNFCAVYLPVVDHFWFGVADDKKVAKRIAAARACATILN